MTYLEKNFIGKDCLIVFRSGHSFCKIKIYGIDSMGVSAMEYKTKPQKEFGLLYHQKTFSNETDFNLIHYPWTSIHKIKIWGENEDV